MDATTSRDHYTARVTGRTVLARTLQKPEWAQAIRDAGLVVTDLAEVQRQGEAAEEFDRQQHEQLAKQQQDISAVVQARGRVASEEEHLRNRLLAVIDDLAAAPATLPLARWLALVTFERYRIRVSTLPLPEDAPDGAKAPEERTRVTRQDRLSWAQSLSHFTHALLEPGREPIVEQLQQRGMSRDRLQALADDASALVGRLGGKAALAPVEATRAEAAAAHAQRLRWHSCRRMIRRVVKEHPELSPLWAAC